MNLENRPEIPLVIEVIGASESFADGLRGTFSEPGEDVAFSRAFGGSDIVAVITTLGAISKLLSFLSKNALPDHKTTIRIEKRVFILKGFTYDEVTELLKSPELAAFVDAIQQK